MSQTSAPSPASSASHTSFKQGVTYTYFGGNSFHLKFQATGARVLVDPWLVDDLVFGGVPWLYRGTKDKSKKIVDVAELAADTDLLVVSQGLDDHCHIPTLKALPRSLPVIAQEGAAQTLKGLGFTSVTTIKHGQTLSALDGRLRITGTKGALTGPPWSTRQMGLVFRESAPDGPKADLHHASVYYEAHCDFDAASVKTVGQVDVVISPVRSVLLNLGFFSYPILRGDMNLDELMGLLQPRVLLPLMNDEIQQAGLISSAVTARGDLGAVQARLAAAGLPTRVEHSAPLGEALSIAL